MTIERGCVSIELTENEMIQAYYEQQHQFDIEDVIQVLEDEIDDLDVSDETIQAILNDPSALDEIATDKRNGEYRLADLNNEADWRYATVHAIELYLRDHPEEE